MEKMPPEAEANAKFSVEMRIAILRIENDRMTDFREVLADLVASPRLDLGFHKGAKRDGMPAKSLQNFVRRLRVNFFRRGACRKRFRNNFSVRHTLNQRDIFFVRFRVAQNLFKHGAIAFMFPEEQNAGRRKI